MIESQQNSASQHARSGTVSSSVSSEVRLQSSSGQASITPHQASDLSSDHMASASLGGIAESRRRIYAFFAKHLQDSTINVHGEAQKVMENLKQSSWWQNFELDSFPLTTYDSFRDMIRDRVPKNVVVTCFSGHCGKKGQLCFNKNETGTEMEEIHLSPSFVLVET